MAGFRNVRPTREMQFRAQPTMATDDKGVTTFAGGLRTGGQVSDLGGGNFGVTAGAGSVGEKGVGHFDDPVVNAIAKLPSQAEAADYAGTKPSFYGVQRPEDYQRVVQQQMAADALPGGQEELANRIRNRITKANIGNVYG